MKVILNQDVPKLGNAGTVQDVANGYARNFLIPQKLAVAATSGSIKVVEERQASEARKISKLEEQMRGLSDRIQGMRIQIEARVGEQGRLFGSVTASDVAEELSKQVGEEIDRRKVDLEEPIRTVGEHQVTVRLVGRLTPTIKVVVWDPEHVEVAATDSAEIDDATAEADGETAEDDATTDDLTVVDEATSADDEASDETVAEAGEAR